MFINLHRINRAIPLEINPGAIATMAVDRQGRAVLTLVTGSAVQVLETPAQVKALMAGDPLPDAADLAAAEAAAVAPRAPPPVRVRPATKAPVKAPA